jgi:accessory Sec system glycosyltransferase GtfB
MAVGANENVFLYPNVKTQVLDHLFEKCDIYLDINREGEIVDAVHRAFLNNQLIIAFEETMHNAYYTAPTNTFPEKEYRELAEALNTALRMPQIIDQALQMQKNAALTAKKEDYSPIVG